MEFSKDNIVSKHFSKKILGGLDEFEVRDFLHALAEEIRHLTQKNSLLKKQVQDQEKQIQEFRDREHILKESIANAEKWAEKIRKDAEDNSCLILEKAQDRSEALIQDARHSLQTVYNDIADLKRLQLQFKTGLKAALQVQMDLLDQEPVFSPDSSLPLNDVKEQLAEKPMEKEASPLNLEPAEEEEADSMESERPMPNKKELDSLKEHLSSLNKHFS